MASGANGVVLGMEIRPTLVTGATVDLASRSLVGAPTTVAVPRFSTPRAFARAAGRLAVRLDFCGPVGVSLPAVVIDGVVRASTRLDPSWNGVDLAELLSPGLRGPVRFINSADSFGLVEMRYGAGTGQEGLVIVASFGATVGVAAFDRGRLIPNTQLGRIQLNGAEMASGTYSETTGSAKVDWASHARRYLRALEGLLTPDLIVVSGDGWRDPRRWLRGTDTQTPVRRVEAPKNAIILGAALAADEALGIREGYFAALLRTARPTPNRFLLSGDLA